MGGQSAFGTKAGDLFTKITVGVAAFWILISILAAMYAPNLAGNQMNVTQNSQVECKPAAWPRRRLRSLRKARPAKRTRAASAGKPWRSSKPPVRAARPLLDCAARQRPGQGTRVEMT